MNLAVEEIVPFDGTYRDCYVQSCVAPCDQFEHQPFTQSGAFFKKNAEFLEQARQAGVIIAGTCAPYLTGWLPIRGEHFVTTESGVTVMGNSIWGAMGNSDGIEAAFWSAICGRTPRWGNHVEENRGATHVVEVQTEVNSLLEWDLLGRAIGEPIPTRAVPVISGEFQGVTFQKLRQLCTTLAISSNCEICHLAGYTPEARSVEDALRGNEPFATLVIDEQALRSAYEAVCDPGEGEIDFVSLGCPHLDIDQIKRVSDSLTGKHINPNVHFMLWTVYPIKAMADENGYTHIIEQAGGHIYTSSCAGSMGKVFLENYNGFVFDSLKQAGSVKSETDRPVYFGDVQACIDAAVAGRWQEKHRWPRSR
jgi:predicted aconitase